jgi:hypothetical protein
MVQLHVFLAGASARARNPIICDGLMVHHQSMRARLSPPPISNLHRDSRRFADIVADTELKGDSTFHPAPKTFCAPQSRERGTNCFFDLQTVPVFIYTQKKSEGNCQLARTIQFANCATRVSGVASRAFLHIYPQRKSYFARQPICMGCEMRQGYERPKSH